jgi:hypothetical protein
MSDSPAPDSPPPLIYLDSETERGESPEQKSALYQSLAAAIEHPNCATAAWIDTVGDFKNNPRTFHDPPYNDGSAHWIDTGGHVLCMAFPAVLDLNGKYGRTGPYFSLAGGQGVKVGHLCAFILPAAYVTDVSSTAWGHRSPRETQSRLRTKATHPGH